MPGENRDAITAQNQKKQVKSLELPTVDKWLVRIDMSLRNLVRQQKKRMGPQNKDTGFTAFNSPDCKYHFNIPGLLYPDSLWGPIFII